MATGVTPVLTKSRTVSLRFAVPEYERILSICAREGRRSISELVRVALQEYTDLREAQVGTLGSNLTIVSARLRHLDAVLRELSSLIEQTLGPDEAPRSRCAPLRVEVGSKEEFD